MSIDATGRDVETDTCTGPTSVTGDGSKNTSTATGTALPSSPVLAPVLALSAAVASPSVCVVAAASVSAVLPGSELVSGESLLVSARVSLLAEVPEPASPACCC
ncbi:hypothetical protein [Nannocystis pusilla]|uniref:hypothetical protein n=1 Tax=Nannocystis pusilla TaxID=889268 RepID=UPI003B78ABD9